MCPQRAVGPNTRHRHWANRGFEGARTFQDFKLPNSGCFLTQFQVRDYVPEVIWTLGVTSAWSYGVAKIRFFKVIFGHTSPRCRTTCLIYGTSGALTRF